MPYRLLWDYVSPLSALSLPWRTTDNFLDGSQNWLMVKLDQFPTKQAEPSTYRPNNWDLRIDLSAIPHLGIPSLSPQFTYAFGSRSIVAVGETTFYLWDIRADSGLAVASGRHSPCHRMKGWSRGGSVQEVGYDYGPVSEDLDGTMRAIRADLLPSFVMFVPRRNSQTYWGGAYVCRRVIAPRALVPQGGAVVGYADTRLPNAALLEIGELIDGAMVPRASLVVAGAGSIVDCGLALAPGASPAATRFVCADISWAVSVLEFDFEPEDSDSVLAGIKDADPIRVAFGGGEWAYPIAFTTAAYSGVANFPAFAIQEIDHGKLVQLSHFAGATATKPFHETGNQFTQLQLPKNEEWGPWEHSLWYYTPHQNAIVSLEHGTLLRDFDSSRVVASPVYGLRAHEYGGGARGIEPYPSRQVDAYAVCLESTQHCNHVTPHSELAGHLPGVTANNDMVICGKRVKSVTVKLEPWAAADIEDVPVGISAIDTPSPLDPFNVPFGGNSRHLLVDGWNDGSENTFGSNLFFETTQSVPVPDGFREVGTNNNPNPPPILQGIVVRNRVHAADELLRTVVPKGAISAQIEKDVILHEHCRVARVLSVGGPITPQNIKGLHQNELEGAPLSFPPLSGTYECSRFSVGDYPVAGNWFRFQGTGQWSHAATMDYKVYLATMEINDYWQFWSSPGFYTWGLQVRATSRELGVAAVNVSESWSFETDHVEIYAELYTSLQEAGQFDAGYRYEPQFGDFRDEVFSDQLIPDEPRGRLSEVVIYTEGNEPRPAIGIRLHGRGVMRGSLAVDVDVSEVPVDYPWSLENAESAKVESMAGGIDGKFVGDQWQTLDLGTSPFSAWQHQFNADQTGQLLAGEMVTATRWAEDVDDPSEPAVWAYSDTVRQYKVSVQLEFV
jgi:hypothetical protein